MRRYRRWIAGLLAAGVLTAVSIFAGLAVSPAVPFAELRINASGMDTPERSISVDVYRREGGGLFQVDSSGEYTCRLNRVTRDAGLYIQASAEGVWVSVDYLTDVNGDGICELLEDTDAPVWDVMDARGALARPQPGSAAPTLTSGQPYILSPDLLVYRHRQAVQERLAGGSSVLDEGLTSAARQDFSLCMVRLHRTDPADGQDYTQTYYLQIYDDVLIPFDVSPEDPFYNAVLFCLYNGYFTGTGGGCFSPDTPLTRAQLAQVLWSKAGSPKLEDIPQSQFADVSPDDWFCPAVTWCEYEKLISGYSPDTFAPNDLLTREQMVSILCRYTRNSGYSLRATADMSLFSDLSSVSPWAYDSMRWAATNLLIDTASGLLLPKQAVTRSELAEALYCYDTNLIFEPS